MNAGRALYVMIGVAVVLVALAVWSIDRSGKATAQATQLAADLALIQERQTTSRGLQIAACERGNAIRRKLTSNSLVIRTVSEELARFLETSARFRDSQGETVAAEESRAARRRVDGLADLLTSVPEIDCQRLIP